jgi:hypothetical protein
MSPIKVRPSVQEPKGSGVKVDTGNSVGEEIAGVSVVVSVISSIGKRDSWAERTVAAFVGKP